MMKKTTIMMLLVGFLSIAGLKAQTIQEGISHLYADRFKSATETFQKLVSANPNNLDAIYWLGQSYIASGNVKAALDLYTRTLQSNSNSPLIMAGMGHVLLLQGRKNEAQQLFDGAIAIATGKKGVDVPVLLAIGRAVVDAKDGDASYAIDKLRQAADKDPKNADVFLALGDAYRKAHEGGQAVTSYDKALQLNPNFARAVYRKAMIYYTQKNWDVYEQLLKDAVRIDPKFAPAYYELYYYYLGKLDFNTAQEYANKYTSSSDPDPQNDYLVAQTCFAKKDYACAISTSNSIISRAGEATRPRVYRLRAYSYAANGDTNSARQNMDIFFNKAKEEDVIPADYILRAQLSGDPNQIVESYRKAADMDSVYENKMKILQDGAAMFQQKGDNVHEAEMRLLIGKTRKVQNPQDLFIAGMTFYKGKDYRRADSLFRAYSAVSPDSLYGHYYDARSNLALDTTLSQEPYLSNMVTGFRRTLELAGTNKDKYKNQAVAASTFLAAIYNNTKKNKDSAVYYVNKGLEIDPTNASLLGLKEQLMKPPPPPRPVKGTTPAKKPATKKSTALDTKQKNKAVRKS
jgi:tetratricopeptide (TPR) repeat protein